MGLNASVMCKCLTEGKSQPPPFADEVRIDAEGYLSVDLPYEGNEEKHHLFERWLSSACEHPDMELVSEYISNWGGYRAFQQALEVAGWEHFSTLKVELPEANGGLTATSAASKMLKELRYFAEQTDLGSRTVLVDTGSGEELQQYIAAYEGVFIWGASGVEIGIDERGFFIRVAGRGVSGEVFRSKRFEQRIIKGGLLKRFRRTMVEYVDLDTGERFVCREAVGRPVRWPNGQIQNEKGEMRLDYPVRMEMMSRERKASDFEYILKPLRKICEASMETGNPIRWS
jgi:hypothetical protein